MESFNNNTDNDKIREIKQIFNELRNRNTKNYTKEIKKKLYEIDNKKGLSELEKKRLINILLH